jgi:putative FmdB family regulatory protein
MPLYEYQCADCLSRITEFRSVANRHAEKHCECGGGLNKQIACGYAHSDVDFVTDDINGDVTRVTSRKELRALCEQHNVVEKFGKGWI